jgi:hypothetical protein
MQSVRLSDEYITYILMMLRNTNRPLTTQDLVQALRHRAESGD